MLLDLIADTFGDRTAITDGGESLSFGELRTMAQRVGADLAAGNAATLAFADVCSAAVPTALFGAAWAGASYAPLNFRLPADSLKEQLRRLDRPTTVASDKLCAELERRGSRHPYVGVARVVWHRAVPATMCRPVRSRSRNERRSSCSPVAPRVPRRPPCSRHDNLASYVMDTVEFASADEDEALLLAAPPFHIAGVAAVLTLGLLRPSDHSAARLQRGSLAGARPHRWRDPRLRGADHARPDRAADGRTIPVSRVPTLRSLSYGGARMALPILERALELFPETQLRQRLRAHRDLVDHRRARARGPPRRVRRRGSSRRVDGSSRSAVRCPAWKVGIFDDSGDRCSTRVEGVDPGAGTTGQRPVSRHRARTSTTPDGW